MGPYKVQGVNNRPECPNVPLHRSGVIGHPLVTAVQGLDSR